MAARRAPLLSVRTVTDYLVRSRLLERGSVDSVTELGGGVSNVVLAVRAGRRQWVVKQSLPRLRVEQEWLATQERTVHEARGLRLADRITPGAVPAVVHLDPERYVLVLERAPEGMADWKGRLLAGDVNPEVAACLGRLLGRWHTVTAEHPGLLAELDDPQAFDQLRVGPYHRATATALPPAAAAIGAVVRDMARRRICLVHGDFSPKNVLTGSNGTWVIDFEVAHRGDPDFDVAFLLCHLVCKYVRLPEFRAPLAAAGRAFLAEYHGIIGTPTWLAPDRHRMAHLGALLLARVDGKSPMEYLDGTDRAVVRRLGMMLVGQPLEDAGALWTTCDRELRMGR